MSRENEELNKAPGESSGLFLLVWTSLPERIVTESQYFEVVAAVESGMLARDSVGMLSQGDQLQTHEVTILWDAAHAAARCLAADIGRQVHRLVRRGQAGALASMLAAVLSTGTAAWAQCEPVWQPLVPPTVTPTGTNGNVYCMALWDPDGSGPMTTKVVVGGTFNAVGTMPASKVALYDPVTGDWSALGAGVSATVNAIAVLPNGDLVVGGEFSSADGIWGIYRVARWNGLFWSGLGSGMGFDVRALKVLPNGDLVAGGKFPTAGGTPANRIARWDGANWWAMGAGLGTGVSTVHALAVLPNGDVVAGGQFSLSSPTRNNIARWNGSTWLAMSSGSNTTVLSVLLRQNGDLIAGGSFFIPGGFTRDGVARWDGTNWTVFAPIGSNIWALTEMPNGDLIAGGEFAGVTRNRIARWDGSGWSSFGSGLDRTVRSILALPDGDVLAGGEFTTASGVSARGIARWGTRRVVVMEHPQSLQSDAGQDITLTSTVNPELIGMSVRWKRDGIDLVDGDGGASPEGGTVSGAFTLLASPTDSEAVTLTIMNAQPSDSGVYTAVFISPCGSMTSQEAIVVVNPTGPICADCAADYDQDGGVTGADVGAFFGDFEQGLECADVDVDGGVTGADIAAFFLVFEAGGC